MTGEVPLPAFGVGSAALVNPPRLLYVGDVGVESTVGGSLLLYRLLQEYPVSRLCIVEGNWKTSDREARLPGVQYETLRVGSQRILRTRFHPYYSSFLNLIGRLRSRQLKRLVEDFQPQAVLTTVHGYSWLTAAAVAERFQLPMHVIVHDDWVSAQRTVLPKAINRFVDARFGELYRRAASRFCVSSFMVEAFDVRYRAKGTVLYPLRDAGATEYTECRRGTATDGSPVFAFAGTINTPGYAESLRTFAKVVVEQGARLLVYSNLSSEGIKHCGLDRSNVSVRSLVHPRHLLAALRSEADVLLVPMSFAKEDLLNMQLAFPSKLADYTAVGLALLIWGPRSCSAVRWAKENPKVAEIVDEPGEEALRRAIHRLAHETSYRQRLAEVALVKGREYFSYAGALEKFYEALTVKSHTTSSLQGEWPKRSYA